MVEFARYEIAKSISTDFGQTINLRRILLDYLRIELRSAVPLFTEELLSSQYDLFEVLDLAGEETINWYNKQKQLQETT